MSQEKFIHTYVCPRCNNEWKEVGEKDERSKCLECARKDIAPASSEKLAKAVAETHGIWKDIPEFEDEGRREVTMNRINSPGDLLIELLGGIDLEELKYQKKMLASMSGGTASSVIEGVLNLLDVITDFMEDHPDDVGRMRVKRKDAITK